MQFVGRHTGLRDGKSLQNSTRKTSSLKNLHTKYVQKLLKIVQNLQKMPKIALKNFNETREKKT